VLEGTSAGGHFGLVILLREGVAAWMAHASAFPVARTAPTKAARPMPASVISDEIHTDMVAVLANMAMAIPEVPEELCA